MNGYQLHADTYKRVLESDNLTGEAREIMERRIASLEIMAKADRPTQYELFNTSGFNDICKGYLLMTLDNIGADAETRKRAVNEMSILFDKITAEQAERYYMEH